jgi:Zn-finger nucleic acid-binding protein
MRCAACYAVVDPEVDARCACGAVLGDAPAREAPRAVPAAKAAPKVAEAVTYRSAEVAPTPPRPPLELSFGRTLEGAGCPDCDGALAARDTFHACNTCDGVFVQRMEFDALLAFVDHRGGRRADPRGAPLLDRYLQCPVCDRLMKRTIFGRRSGIVVDACDAHGTWFDGEEVGDAARFLERGGIVDVDPTDGGKKLDPKLARATAEAQVALLGETHRINDDIRQVFEPRGGLLWRLLRLFG